MYFLELKSFRNSEHIAAEIEITSLQLKHTISYKRLTGCDDNEQGTLGGKLEAIQPRV